MSFLSRYLIPAAMKDRVKTRLQKYGGSVPLGNERIPEVYSIARGIYKALADRLGDQPYFFGDR